jgi:hypothetical protein
MKPILVAALLGLVTASTPAYAQPAAAIGKPLPSPDVEVGTVSVRVVAGSLQDPVIGTDVTLVVNGTPRVARTGNDGRAFFKGLPAGAQVQAKVTDEDKKEVVSETFGLPAQSGVKVMLSTRPFTGGAMGGGPMAAGGQGMPNPRQMSGEPRPEQQDPPGTVTARVTYDDFNDKTPPANVPVALVGYHADDSIDLQVVNTDAAGRATFKGLDRSGATSYFAMTLLERAGKHERLASIPAMLDSRAGVRVILSGEKRDSTAPPADDLNRFEKQGTATPGKVTVTLEGGVDATTTVALVELTPTERRVFATGRVRQGPPDPSEVQSEAGFEAKPDMPANTVVVNVHGGVNATNAPLSGVSVNLAPAATFQAEEGQVDGVTDMTGSTRIAIDPKTAGPFVASVTINGNTRTYQPFDLAQSGGVLDVEAHWSSEGKPQVEFDVVPRPGQIFYAETTMQGQLYRSLPFQPVPHAGTRVSVLVYPRVLFTFSLTSRVDDEYLAVNGRFELTNFAWAPYAPKGSDGLMIPLPKGFVGGLVAEKDQADVAIVPGEGFRIVRPLAPGKRAFHGAFSLPVKDGSVTWKLDLPFGAFNSGMEILQPPGMLVSTPPGVRGQSMTVPQGTFFVLPQISILPRQSMVMTLSGLPQPPGWKVWLPRIAGVVVLLIIAGGVMFALTRKRGESDAERFAHRAKLLDELAELERSGKNLKRREQITAELETLWDVA